MRVQLLSLLLIFSAPIAEAADPEPPPEIELSPPRRAGVPEKGALLLRRTLEERRADGTVDRSIDLVLLLSDGDGNVREERGDRIILRSNTGVVKWDSKALRPVGAGASSTPSDRTERVRAVREALAEHEKKMGERPEPPRAKVVEEKVAEERLIAGEQCRGTRLVTSAPAHDGNPASKTIFEEWRSIADDRIVQQVRAEGDGSRIDTKTFHRVELEIEGSMFELP